MISAQPDSPGLNDPDEAALADVLRPGRNCWMIAYASRAAVLTNAEYFAALASSLKQAQRLVVINGWIFDPALVLNPWSSGPESLPLLDFLEHLLAERPGLRMRLLLWDRTVLYGGNHGLPKHLARIRRRRPGLDFRFVSPGLGASNHQKIVSVDGAVAFIGGIDLASDRWDRKTHRLHDRLRKTAEGEPYGPIHDVQMVVEGAAAAAIAAFAADQWDRAADEELDIPAAASPAWPEGVTADLTNAPVAVARNDAFCRERPIREIAFLYHDVLRMARRSIYIEAQYLAAEGIGEILRERLSETNPPEIVIILSRIYPGYLERFVMGRNRERLLRRIVQADHAGKLRVYYPVSRAANAQRSIKIHAKLMIADSCFLKIGSSNLNNRSLGTDVECDAVIAARSAAHRTRIAAVQARLLAEHMQRPAAEVAVRLEETGSLFATIDSLDEGRRLRPHALRSMQGPSSPILLTPLLDPEQPISLRYLAQALCGRPAKMRERRLCDE